MLTCIACSKQLNTGSLREPEEDDTAATPSKKQAIKALTAQIKDMAAKASGAYKNCKPCSGGSNHNQNPNYADSETGSVSERFHYSYKRAGSSNSTPKMKGRLKVLSSGESTPVSVSGRSESVVGMEDDDESKEWVAQVEPGVLITFVSLPEGGNDLKRIRFSREIFNKWQAQRWWAENYDKVMELYNVRRFNQQAVPLPTPPKSEDEQEIQQQQHPNADSIAAVTTSQLMGQIGQLPMLYAQAITATGQFNLQSQLLASRGTAK
ncbi:protein Brevis radix-like 2 isoform X2 [Nicotiana tabacum]|uniref:Protein Brevis radix-like 2 isoform X2 n=1 Tax=Nicotiana tabacum TaxID=4097 RepID=A0AC58RQH9_TOBAC